MLLWTCVWSWEGKPVGHGVTPATFPYIPRSSHHLPVTVFFNDVPSSNAVAARRRQRVGWKKPCSVFFIFSGRAISKQHHLESAVSPPPGSLRSSVCSIAFWHIFLPSYPWWILWCNSCKEFLISVPVEYRECSRTEFQLRLILLILIKCLGWPPRAGGGPWP